MPSWKQKYKNFLQKWCLTEQVWNEWWTKLVPPFYIILTVWPEEARASYFKSTEVVCATQFAGTIMARSKHFLIKSYDLRAVHVGWAYDKRRNRECDLRPRKRTDDLRALRWTQDRRTFYSRPLRFLSNSATTLRSTKFHQIFEIVRSVTSYDRL